jgi:acetyl esterase/lipase
MREIFRIFPAFLASLIFAQVGPADLLKKNAPPGKHIQYADGELQFGELRLPDGPGPHPVIMLIHGGCWVARIPSLPAEAATLAMLRPMSVALAESGIATWNVEYRRVGNSGGGWPGSFDDVRRAAAHLAKIADGHNLDLRRAVVAGHSAGGHLALWIAAETKVPSFRAAVDLDGPTDLRSAQPDEQKICGQPAITNFVGGTPEQYPERYDLLAAWPKVRVHLIGGTLLRRMTDQVKVARKRNAIVTELPDASHFDMLSPESKHWPVVLTMFRELTK